MKDEKEGHMGRGKINLGVEITSPGEGPKPVSPSRAGFWEKSLRGRD